MYLNFRASSPSICLTLLSPLAVTQCWPRWLDIYQYMNSRFLSVIVDKDLDPFLHAPFLFSHYFKASPQKTCINKNKGIYRYLDINFATDVYFCYPQHKCQKKKTLFVPHSYLFNTYECMTFPIVIFPKKKFAW